MLWYHFTYFDSFFLEERSLLLRKKMSLFKWHIFISLVFLNYYMNTKNSFDHLLNAVNGKKGTKKYIVYKHLKPLLIEKIKECAFLDGFKSIRINLDHFLTSSS